jgi:hypothetical protein
MARAAAQMAYSAAMRMAGANNSGMLSGQQMFIADQEMSSLGYSDENAHTPYQNRTNSFASNSSGTATTSSSGHTIPMAGIPMSGYHPNLFTNDNDEYLDEEEGFQRSEGHGSGVALASTQDDTPRRAQLSRDMIDFLSF